MCFSFFLSLGGREDFEERRGRDDLAVLAGGDHFFVEKIIRKIHPCQTDSINIILSFYKFDITWINAKIAERLRRGRKIVEEDVGDGEAAGAHHQRRGVGGGKRGYCSDEGDT